MDGDWPKDTERTQDAPDARPPILGKRIVRYTLMLMLWMIAPLYPSSFSRKSTAGQMVFVLVMGFIGLLAASILTWAAISVAVGHRYPIGALFPNN